MSHRRTATRVSERVADFDPSLVLRLAEEPADAPEQRQLRRAARAALSRALTPVQQKYLRCYYQDGMTMREIAARYGVAIPTVSRTIKRARTRLYDLLQYYINIRSE